MIFSSFEFILFFFIFFLIHALIPNKYRIASLLVANVVFYSFWKIEYLWLPFVLITVAHAGLRWMLLVSDESRKYRLFVVICLLLLPLTTFKYANFFYQDVIGLFLPGTSQIMSGRIPLGISFITFTLIAYVVDVATGKFQPKPGALTVFTYTSFFPQIAAGPIMRPGNLVPQFLRYRFVKTWFWLGLLVFSIGLVKKVVFADQLGLIVDSVYAAPYDTSLSLLDYWLAFYGFSAQIYCDFSGYTDMAIGLAFMLGIRFPINFDRPYLSHSIAEFWHRWHMTLSFWIRDYIYIPLGGNRRGKTRQLVNLLIAMGLAGLWHGASWTFILWGLFHGIGIASTHMTRGFTRIVYFLELFPKWLKIIFAFHLISLGWVLFRAWDLYTFAGVIQGLAGQHGAMIGENSWSVAALPISLIIVLLALHPLDTLPRMRLLAMKLKRKPIIFAAVIIGLWLLAITMGIDSSAEFIYFDF